MRAVNSFITESRNFNAAAAADQLIRDLMESGLFTSANWYTDDEIDGVDMADRTVWYINREGYVSSSTYDEDGAEIGWSPIAGGACFDRLYVSEGKIRHTARSYALTPPDMIVVIN